MSANLRNHFRDEQKEDESLLIYFVFSFITKYIRFFNSFKLFGVDMKAIAIFMIVMMSWVCCVAAESEDVTGEVAERITDETYETLDSLFSLYQPYLTNIGPYKPIYFLLGADPKDSKFQISLKYQLLGTQCPLSKSCEWMRWIYLGYTQTSLWDLKSDSAPFEDTSYQPEVFMLTHNVSLRPGWLDGLFYQAGVLHESNGRGGDESRSTNYLYLSPSAIFYNENSGMGLQVSPRFVYFFNNSDETNPDVDKYRGNFELELKTGFANGFVLGANFHFASKDVSTQLDLTYPLSMGFFSNLEFYLQAQYVNTYAETLLDYDERNEALRIGISIVR
jgi:outer membrane phospholipase A